MRRWCACEFFYSAIDDPWFAKQEFVEYLYHVGLGHVPRLTRVEWGVIRRYLIFMLYNTNLYYCFSLFGISFFFDAVLLGNHGGFQLIF